MQNRSFSNAIYQEHIGRSFHLPQTKALDIFPMGNAMEISLEILMQVSQLEEKTYQRENNTRPNKEINTRITMRTMH